MLNDQFHCEVDTEDYLLTEGPDHDGHIKFDMFASDTAAIYLSRGSVQALIQTLTSYLDPAYDEKATENYRNAGM